MLKALLRTQHLTVAGNFPPGLEKASANLSKLIKFFIVSSCEKRPKRSIPRRPGNYPLCNDSDRNKTFSQDAHSNPSVRDRSATLDTDGRDFFLSMDFVHNIKVRESLISPLHRVSMESEGWIVIQFSYTIFNITSHKKVLIIECNFLILHYSSTPCPNDSHEKKHGDTKNAKILLQ